MPTLQKSLDLIAKVRDDNPQLSDLNDQEVADLLFTQTSDERLAPAARSGAVSRGIAKLGQTFSDLGTSAESAIVGKSDSFPLRVVGRAANQLVSSLPELGINLGSLALRGLPRYAGLAGGAGFSYQRALAETGSEKAALGSAAGSLLSLAGGVGGGALARKAVGDTGLKGFAAGSLGSAAGSVPGDVLEIATAPGGIAEFLKDPVNLPAYALGNVGFGVAVDAASEISKSRAEKAQARKAETPNFEDLISKDDETEFARLSKLPAAQITEVDLARKSEIGKRLAERDRQLMELKVAKTANVIPQDLSTLPEAPVTYKTQLHLLNTGKKAVIEVPKGSELPVTPPHEQIHSQYVSPVNGNLYVYDDAKVTPDMIDNAVKSDTLGILLGYGTPSIPKNPTGKVAVLRNKHGVEKQAVILGDGNESAVTKALSDMSLGDDKVSIEDAQQVAEWRARNTGLQRLYSIASDAVDPNEEFKFTARVFDSLNRAFSGSNVKGARFTLDAEGKVGSKGLRKALSQWVPPDIFAHYERAGLDELLREEKVSAADFNTWLRQKTPEVEIKKLQPFEATDVEQQKARIQHEFETRGYKLETDPASSEAVVKDQTGNEVRRLALPADLVESYDLYDQIVGGDEELTQRRLGASDAATGKYGVEPKPLDQMPEAVDILVRLPSLAGKAADPDAVEPLFRGPHFGDSDKNVLASIRGYMEALPSGEKVFHVFELQSDWGQKVSAETQRSKELRSDPNIKLAEEIVKGRLEEKDGVTYEQAVERLNEANFSGRVRGTKDHSLLSHYETLGLKAAIQHAREAGAKYIAISDAETAMMTERHTDYVRFTPGVYTVPGLVELGKKSGFDLTGRMRINEDDSMSYEVRVKKAGSTESKTEFQGIPGARFETNPGELLNTKVVPGARPPQEKGMIAAYNERLPKIAVRLTRSAARRVDFGKHIHPDKKAVFGDGKTNITARLYDISNPSPEVKFLFSLYDMKKQGSFEASLEKGLNETGWDKQISEQELLERSIAGDSSVVKDALLNFLRSISGTRGILREGVFLNPKIVASLDTDTFAIKFNKDLSLKTNEAFRVLAHELSHGAIETLRREDADTYQKLEDLTRSIGPEGRYAIMKQLSDQLKMGDRFNPEYLAGKLFDEKEAHYDKRVTHEFIAGLVEATAQFHFNQQALPSWFDFLPQPVLRALSKVASLLRTYFSKDFPSVTHMLDERQGRRLSSLVDLINDRIVKAEEANIRAVLGLKKSKLFDETSFATDAPNFRQNMRDSSKGPGEFYSFASDLYNNTVGKVETAFEKYVMSALFRTRTHPYTSDFFWAMHNMRPNMQAEEYGYHAFIGQKPDGSLSREQALERSAKFIDGLVNPNNKRRNFLLDAFSKIVEENQNRREDLMNKRQEVTADKLVTRSEMQSKYKVSEEEAEFFARIIDIPEVVAKEMHRKAELVDTYALARLFFRANKKQNIQATLEKVTRLNRITNDFGDKRFELGIYKKRLQEENKKANPDLETQGLLGEHIQVLEAEQAQFKLLLENAILTEFQGLIPLKPQNDPFVAQVGELMVRMAAIRAQNRFITKDAGYAPMTRRGRFLLRVYENSELGEEFASVAEFRGFDSEKEALEYVREAGITSYELIDKQTIRGRVQAFTPDKLKGLRDQAKAQLGELVSEIASKTADMDPAQREVLLETLSTLERNFRPLEDEIKDVLAVKGDKFKERRWMVSGFDRNDFLPNIFEYMNYKTVSGNKNLTRATAELQLERPELDENPEMRTRMQTELNYVLSNQTEFNGFRKAIFYYYLGASFRHVIQNALQIPLNGISEMVSRGGGFNSYKHFGKAAALTSKYLATGTTGDVQIDSMLKQAERDGISFETALEAPVEEAVGLQNAIDSITGASSGVLAFGEKVNYAKTQMWKGFEKFMQSTSTAAESANRKTTFIAAVLDERARGNTDLRSIYGHASQFTNLVNFVGDKPNRPGLLIMEGGRPMHGPLVVLTALQSFTVNHISQLYSYYKSGFRNGNTNDKKAFATGLAHLLTFAGSMGFIGASTAEALFEELFGFSLKTAIRRNLVENLPFDNATSDRIADGVLHGLPALAGVDMSGSIGLGSPFIRYQAGQPLTIEQFGGAGVGMLGRVAQGVGEVKADPFNPQQWWQATRTAAPAALSNMIKAFELMNAGTVLDTKGQPVTEPLDAVGSASVLAGFTPMQVSKQRAFNSEVYKASKKSAEEYQLAVRNTAKSLDKFYREGDPEALAQANATLSKYLSENPDQNRDALTQSVTEQLLETQGKVTKPASLKDSARRQQIESAFPSVKPRYPSELSTLFQELEVSQLLGQDDLLMKKLQSLPSSVLDALLTDELVSSGFRPEQVGSLLSPSLSGAR